MPPVSPPQSSTRAGAPVVAHALDGGAGLAGEDLADHERVNVVAVVAAEDDRGLVVLVAHHRRRVDLQHARALLRDRGEHALRARLGGDERGHPAQRALLGRELRDLGELGLRVARQRVVLVARRAVGEVDAGGDEADRVAASVGHRAVRPGDQAPPAFLGLPVADLRARLAGLPHVRQELAERLALLDGDHELARVAPEQLLAAKPGRPLAGVVEQHDPAVAVEYADERLRRLGEDRGERLAEFELSRLRRVVHVRSGAIVSAGNTRPAKDRTPAARRAYPRVT